MKRETHKANEVDLFAPVIQPGEKEKFLAHVARYLLEKNGTNMSGVTMLMPNHRSCIYLRQALINQSTQTIWSPEIVTLQDWIFDQSELSIIEPLEQLMELYSVYREKGGEETLDEFIPTAQIMLNDFNEVDQELVNAKTFFNYLEQLQSLKVYEPGAEPTEYSIKYRKFWQLFRELYFGFRERMIEKKKGYAGMLYRNVAEKIDSIQNESTHTYMAGFSGLNKSEEKIVKALQQNGPLEILWDSDVYYVDDPMQEAGAFFRKYKSEFRVDDSQWQNNLVATNPNNINIVGVAKNIGQTKVLADILANKLNIKEGDEKETVVVVLDEKLLNPVLSAIPENITTLNITMGYPLGDSSIAELIRCIFSLHENVDRFKGANHKGLRFYYNDIFDLLHHPYTNYLIPNKQKATGLIENIKSRNRMVVEFSELAEIFQGTGFERIFWYTSDVNEYIEQLLLLVEALRIHFLKLTRNRQKDLSIDIELLFHISNTLKNLQNIVLADNKNGVDEVLQIKSLRKLITEAIRAIRIPFDGEPVRGLQIMGMIETRCLDFRNVIILSMNEGIFPAGKTTSSYIPFEMRREFLTTHKEKESISAYLFYRLLQRSENVYLLYNTESDEMGGGEKSRFILQLEHELKEANPSVIINDLVYSVDPPPAIPEDEINIVKDETLMAPFIKNITEFGISPSAINTYINCSLQYYFRYLAQLREKDDIEENIEAATLGSAIHFVLENLYKDLPNDLLTFNFVDAATKDKKRIRELLHESFEKRFDGESLKRGKNYLLYRVSLKLIDEFLKQEKRNLKTLEESGRSMKLLMLEQEMAMPLNVRGYDVLIKGKVDRVEWVNDTINIADYKTGTPSPIKSDEVALFATDPKYAKAMQLLNYAWLYWKTNDSKSVNLRSGIYWLRESGKGFDPLKMNGEDKVTNDIFLQFEEVLKNVLGELLNTEIPFSKTKDIARCEHCEFIRICRRD